MSLKELTSVKHKQAEQTKFMQRLIQGKISTQVWAEFVFQKMIIYRLIEQLGIEYCNLTTILDIFRADFLHKDLVELSESQDSFCQTSGTKDYCNYLLNLDDPKKIMAHIYVWYMGDLFGGQLIKRFAPGKNLALEFNNREQIISFIRTNCNDEMADEANVAFEFAIQIMNNII
jgi:heme oxygenase